MLDCLNRCFSFQHCSLGTPTRSNGSSKRRSYIFLDTGLLATTRGLTFDKVKADRGLIGALLETFVFSEVLKLMTASDMRLSPHHFHDQQMREVDIVLERDDGMIVGIEVKASATVRSSDFGGCEPWPKHAGNGLAMALCCMTALTLCHSGIVLLRCRYQAFGGHNEPGEK